MVENQNFFDKFNETLIGWQLGFEEPIFSLINDKRIKADGVNNLPLDEQEYFKYQTNTFKLEMFATAFVLPINFFSIMYHNEEKKQMFKNTGKVKFYYYGALVMLLPCICSFGYAIYRRNMTDLPHEKALTSKYYYELKKSK